MGLFDFFKKPKSDVEMYYEQRGKKAILDEYANVTMQTGDLSGNDFRFVVEDVFTITGRGTVVTGKVISGMVHTGDTVILQRVDGSESKVTITGIEAFRKLLDAASVGEHVGLFLRNVAKNEIGKNDILRK
ncbi:MAG: hypothetical protein J6A77_01665 [Lachnospiraceae bacterium]|nr:hypothetical protein [Lachnospiraceae bacterium]